MRRAREFADGALRGAVSVPLDALNEQQANIPVSGPVYIRCIYIGEHQKVWGSQATFWSVILLPSPLESLTNDGSPNCPTLFNALLLRRRGLALQPLLLLLQKGA